VEPSSVRPDFERARGAAAQAALALVVGGAPIVRAGIAAVIREEFGARSDVRSATWAERHAALVAAGGGGLGLAVMLPERAALIVDWPALALAAPGVPIVLGAVSAELAARQATAPAGVRVIALVAPLAAWRKVLRDTVAGTRRDPAAGGRAVRPRRPLAPAPLRAGAARIALTQRQREVFSLLSLGYSNRDIAERLGLSTGTVKLHVGAVLQAVQAKNRIELLLRHTRASHPGDERFGIEASGVVRRPIPLTSEES
jgi:DNA-binding NarL/FixJ family response regulator